MKTGLYCNHYRIFPVTLTGQLVPCFHPMTALLVLCSTLFCTAVQFGHYLEPERDFNKKFEAFSEYINFRNNKEYTQNTFILAICLPLTLNSITLLFQKTFKQKSPKNELNWKIFSFFRSLFVVNCFLKYDKYCFYSEEIQQKHGFYNSQGMFFLQFIAQDHCDMATIWNV